MHKIAIVDKYNNSKINYKEYFDFDFDLYHLFSSNIKKPVKADISLELDILEEYDYVILVGSEPCKFIAKIGSVVKYQGYLVEDKYLPIINPSMLAYKPDSKPAFKESIKNVKEYIFNNKQEADISITLIDNEEDALNYLSSIKNCKLLSLDSETSALYPRDGYVLGISISTDTKSGTYIISDVITEECEVLLQDIFNNNKVIFHNAKFDIGFFNYHFNWTFPDWEDAMLIHYLLDENKPHDLKYLAIKYTELGDYDRELEEYKKDYCKKHGILVSNFTYDLIPYHILGKYAAKDAVATLALYKKLYPYIDKNEKLKRVYNSILKRGTNFLIKVNDNGIPFARERLKEASSELSKEISILKNKFYEYEEIHNFEKQIGKVFNPNSYPQLRTLFFSVLGLPEPSKRTDSGQLSTDAEVLEDLSQYHEIPKLVLEYKQKLKIKSTFIDKVLLGLDHDDRLRTNFNLHIATSGRLSSSGKLNAQQMPRDDKKLKYCIKASKDWKIISQDLKTAEMYIAAALSKDKNLCNIFIKGGDYHGFMAKFKYNLTCSQDDVAKLYPELRQEAKTISFEILYKLNYDEPVLRQFPTLKRWLKSEEGKIRNKGFVYQVFGRKRRLPNVFSNNKGVVDHEVRSGVNSLFQGPASDINLLAAIEMQEYIDKNNMKSEIFALVHDSILAHVPNDEIERYTSKLKELTQKDRGVMIPNCPIGVDVNIGDDYMEAA